MAQLSRRRHENVEGNYYVDDSCIDCDTCRWMDPKTFSRAGEQSVVGRQPLGEQEILKANQALLACPTHSIGTEKANINLKKAGVTFPLAIDGPVYHCGYHSDASFGATSYFIESSEGNLLIDSPRFDKQLVKALEERGGVQKMFLTHIDDVADHQAFHDHFKCERIMHEDDMNEKTKSVEHVVRGEECISLDRKNVILPVPGHTKGSMVLIHDHQYCFTGDHLAFSLRVGHLAGFENYCFYSWEAQIQSMEKLAEHSFGWVLPGHGRRAFFGKKEMKEQLEMCIKWMKSR